MYVSNNLKYLRRKYGLSLRVLGKMTNINHTKILRIENNECKDYSIGDINKLAYFFKVNLDDFVNKDLEKFN